MKFNILKIKIEPIRFICKQNGHIPLFNWVLIYIFHNYLNYFFN